eukprot:5452834-Heterocapsa_arctica.AAC.1
MAAKTTKLAAETLVSHVRRYGARPPPPCGVKSSVYSLPILSRLPRAFEQLFKVLRARAVSLRRGLLCTMSPCCEPVLRARAVSLCCGLLSILK